MVWSGRFEDQQRALQGIGAEIQRPLARLVIGGLLSSTPMTLLVLPPSTWPPHAGRNGQETAPTKPKEWGHRRVQVPKNAGFDTQQEMPYRLGLAMKRVIWVAGLLVALIVVLAPMAWASPTDPTWVKGMYDDADFDDVVSYLTCGMTGIVVLPVVDIVTVTAFFDASPLLHDLFPELRPASSRSPRAPPLA